MAPETPEQSSEVAPEVLHMADGCFERAEQASQRGNYDYAIALYLEGLRYNPVETERGHRGLREAALKKKAAQGGGAGLSAIVKQIKAAFYQMLGRHKTAMLAMEAYLASKPNDIAALTSMMQLAHKNGYPDVSIWFGEIAIEQSLRAGKPNKQLFVTMAGFYEQNRQFQKAVDVIAEAIKVDPADRSLDKWLRDLSARGTIDGGGLESVTDFHEMVRDRAQAAESATQKVVRTEDQLLEREKVLREQLVESPEDLRVMDELAATLVRMERVDEGLGFYKKALALSDDYRFQMRIQDVHMSQFRTQMIEIDEALAERAGDDELKRRRAELAKKRNDFELDVFRQRFKQYPTNMGIRHELGLRQHAAGLVDEAIISFQQSRRDAKRRVVSINMLGRCFFAKKLYQEASGQFQAAIESYELSGDPLWKELRYNLSLTYEAMGKFAEAINWYSEIVQMDYQYLDAAKRLDAIRQRLPQQ